MSSESPQVGNGPLLGDGVALTPLETRRLAATERLTKIYGTGDTAVRALADVSISVEPGEFVAVMGPSGCGKSTLLNLLGGLDSPTSGEVFIDGQALSRLDDDTCTALRRRRIGFVFQFFNLVPVLTASENAALPLTLDGDPQARPKAINWLTKLGLGDRVNARPDQLSGGQQQRVAIARALATEPALILADEPTGNLDSTSATDIATQLQIVAKDWGRSVLMVTHDPRIAAFASRLLLMQDGRIVGDRQLDGDPKAAAAAMEEAGLL